MKNNLKNIIIIGMICFWSISYYSQSKSIVWQKGYFDIHHISTGRGDVCLMIFPDGTTCLFDIGNLDQTSFEKKHIPMKMSPALPSKDISVAEVVINYIKKVLPNKKPMLDYAILSHFHTDHYGGIIELAKRIPINTIIDRNYPNYNFPANLKIALKKNVYFQKYLSFISQRKGDTEQLRAGEKNQITLRYHPKLYPDFSVRNVKANATIWTGKANNTKKYFTAKDMLAYYKKRIYNENPLSLALKISYGKFDYFTGGDNTGLQGYGLPLWFDVETPISKAVSKVEVATLDHHGNRDATNENFVENINPKVVIQQSWCSDHPGQEVYQRLLQHNKTLEKREVFATYIHHETLVTYGTWFKNMYKATRGHILVRVLPDKKTYYVYTLKDTDLSLKVKSIYGPYESH